MGTGVENVSSLDGSILFSPTTWAKKKYKSGNKYTAGTSDYYIRNDYLYVTNNLLLEKISLSAMFEDPIAVEYFNNNGECACPGDSINPCNNPMDLNLDIDEYLIDPLVELALKELLEIFSKMTEDNENNAKAAENGKE